MGTSRNVIAPIATSSCSHAARARSTFTAMLRSGITCSSPMARTTIATRLTNAVFRTPLRLPRRLLAAPGALLGAASSGSTRVRRTSAISLALRDCSARNRSSSSSSAFALACM